MKPVEPEKITGNLAKEDTTSQELEVGAHTELNFKVFYSDFSFEDPDRHRNGSVPKRCPSTCRFFFCTVLVLVVVVVDPHYNTILFELCR